MGHNRIHSHAPLRAVEVALLLGAFGLILNGLLGSAKVRRDRRQQREALQTWEGEGGAATRSEGVVRPEGMVRR